MTYLLPTSPNLTTKKTTQLIELKNSLSLFLKNSKKISTTDEYNEFLKDLIVLIKKHPLKKTETPIYTTEIKSIEQAKPLTEKVIWGGVSMKKVDVMRNFIQKLLVIKKYGILGFEIHHKKLEKLRVLEGYCLVIFLNHNSNKFKKGQLSLKIAGPGDKFLLKPLDEHGIIALSNCVIEETSTNHLDDLVYIFTSEQVGINK